MKIKKNINISIDITTDGGTKICTLENGNIIFPDKENILSIKAAYYVISHAPDTNVYQQFTIKTKSNDYYYDCTINPINGNKQLLVTDSYSNVILTIDANVLKEAIDSLFELESIRVDNGDTQML